MISELQQNLKNVITQAIRVPLEHDALLIFDVQSSLARLLADGYRSVLPYCKEINFDTTSPEEIRAAIDTLPAGTLVILVQSTSFRLNEFRFRLELFDRNLVVIEHPHLGRMSEEEHDTYIDSLAYDKEYYHGVGTALKKKIDAAQQIVLSCDGAELVYDGPFESAKLNIGDYTEMKNIGGQFPIGEVFTELVDLTRLNGVLKVFAYADETFAVISPPTPVLINIREGMIVDAPDAPESFTKILDTILLDEPLWIRELGFGLNRAMTKTRRVTDIGSYERMCGIHLSIGRKHTIYTKKGFPKRSSRYHVDVFADVTEVIIDGEVVYKDGGYTLAL